MRIYDEGWRGPYWLLPLFDRKTPLSVQFGGRLVPLRDTDWVDPDAFIHESTPRAFLSIRDGTFPDVSYIGLKPVVQRRVAMRVRDLLTRNPGGEQIAYDPQGAAVTRRPDGTLLVSAVTTERYLSMLVAPQYVARRSPTPADGWPTMRVPGDAGDALQAYTVWDNTYGPGCNGVDDPACHVRARVIPK